MKPRRMFVSVALSATLAFIGVSTAHAGGVMLYEMGTRDVGLAAAGWAARADDASILFRNPAGMSRLPGSNVLFGGQVLYGSMGFESEAGTTTSGGDGGNPIGFLPGGSLFYTRSFASGWAFGLGAFNYFGLAADYDEGWVGRYYVEKSSLLGLSVSPAVSYQPNKNISFGAGLNAMYGILDQESAVPNFQTGTDGRFKLEDKQWGFGANVGVLAETNGGTQIGVNYLSPVKLDFSDAPQFSGLGPILQGALQRRGILGAPLDLGLTVPQTAMVSLAAPLSEDWKVLANAGWQNWKEFGKVEVSLADTLLAATTESVFKDTWHGALGFEWAYSLAWTFTAGFAYDSSAMDEADRTVSLPTGKSYRVGVGAITQASKKLDIGLAYELAYSGDLPVDQMRGPIAGRVVGSYASSAFHFFALHLDWRP